MRLRAATFYSAAALVAVLANAVPGDELQLMSVEPQIEPEQLSTPADRPDITLFADEDALRLSLMVQDLARKPSLQVEPETPGQGLRYSISENMTAAMSYQRAILFERGSNEEVRTSRFSALSTARDRDVLGLGMDWGVGENNTVGFGYQLQSVRPVGGSDPAAGGFSSILPRSEGFDHAFTLGVRRSWGGDD